MSTNPADLVEYQNDHDLLIELRTEMRGIREDLKNMTESMTLKVGDHETRLRLVESALITMVATGSEREKLTRWGGTVVIFVVGIAEFILSQVFK